MTKTYTLVTATSAGGVTILIGSPLDGDTASIDAAIAGHREMEREYRSEDIDAGRDEAAEAEIELIAGCILTDDAPGDEDRILWRGVSDECGWLIDENSVSYEYAVRP